MNTVQETLLGPTPHRLQSLLSKSAVPAHTPSASLGVAYVIGGVSVGGTEMHLLELLRRIDRKRFHPVVVCIQPGVPLRETFSGLGVPVIDLALSRSYSVSGVSRLIRLARQLKARQIRLLHAFNFHGSFYASLVAPFCGRPRLLVSERGDLHRELHRRLARRFYYRQADRILVNCEALRDYVRECCSSEGKILTIPNGIDPGRFHPNGSGRHLRSRLNLPVSAPVIGSIGRLHEIKGHRYLVEAFIALSGTIPEACLLMVGTGPEENGLRRSLREAGLHDRARFVGYQDDVRPYLEVMDYFVLPSLSEAHSMALLEAMAMGKPVLATSVGGNPETVQSEVEGLLVPPASADALRGGLLRLLKEPGLAERLGHGAQRASTRYDLNDMVRRYEDLYLAPGGDPAAGGGTR